MTWLSVMVTGHRPQYLYPEQQDFAEAELARLAVKLRDERGTRVAISGMALGADQWWAHHALAAGLALHAYIPFPTQDARWHHTQQKRWRELRRQASLEVMVSDRYSVAALHQRNDRMLDAADAVVAVWDPRNEAGGTASCVRKAFTRGLPTIIVDLEQLSTRLAYPTRTGVEL